MRTKRALAAGGRRSIGLLAGPLLVTLLLGIPLSASVHAALPRTFFGTMANGVLDKPSVFVSEARLMRSTGLGTVRLPFNWTAMQPYAGYPPDFSTMDGRVATTARNDLDVLALVLDTPSWAALDPGRELSTPRDPAEYTARPRRDHGYVVQLAGLPVITVSAQLERADVVSESPRG